MVLLNGTASLTPSKLAKLTGRSIQTVSTHLAKLRAMDVVRYDTSGKEVRYWLKHKPEMKQLLEGLQNFVVAALDETAPKVFVITAYEPDLQHFLPDFKTRRVR